MWFVPRSKPGLSITILHFCLRYFPLALLDSGTYSTLSWWNEVLVFDPLYWILITQGCFSTDTKERGIMTPRKCLKWDSRRDYTYGHVQVFQAMQLSPCCLCLEIPTCVGQAGDLSLHLLTFTMFPNNLYFPKHTWFGIRTMTALQTHLLFTLNVESLKRLDEFFYSSWRVWSSEYSKTFIL